jgi:hypothetical protein
MVSSIMGALSPYPLIATVKDQVQRIDLPKPQSEFFNQYAQSWSELTGKVTDNVGDLIIPDKDKRKPPKHPIHMNDLEYGDWLLITGDPFAALALTRKFHAPCQTKLQLATNDPQPQPGQAAASTQSGSPVSMQSQPLPAQTIQPMSVSAISGQGLPRINALA